MRIVFVEEAYIDKGFGICVEIGRKAVLDEEQGTITLEPINPVDYILSLKEELMAGGSPTIKILMAGQFPKTAIPDDSYIRLKPGF